MTARSEECEHPVARSPIATTAAIAAAWHPFPAIVRPILAQVAKLFIIYP